MENQKAKAHWLTKPEVKREVVDSMYISTAYVNMVSFRGVGRFFLTRQDVRFYAKWA